MTVSFKFETPVVVYFFCNVEILLILQAPFFAILKNKNVSVDIFCYNYVIVWDT